jgi:histidinol dehydrogenase
MLSIPAKSAGVPRKIVCTPPGEDGLPNRVTLAACALAGVDEVYRIGGIQAIGAMAYGTSAIAPVDVIAGPGNAFVQEAKRQVVGTVGIDMVAGPSEIVVIADETANAAWVAADMLSQAEHGSGYEAAVAVVTSKALAGAIVDEVEAQSRLLPRSESVDRALAAYGTVFIVPDLAVACELTNRIAPEHVEVHTADPWALLDQIRSAGAVLLRRHESHSAHRQGSALRVVRQRGDLSPLNERRRIHRSAASEDNTTHRCACRGGGADGSCPRSGDSQFTFF